jgi:hypothetical protein
MCAEYSRREFRPRALPNARGRRKEKSSLLVACSRAFLKMRGNTPTTGAPGWKSRNARET